MTQPAEKMSDTQVEDLQLRVSELEAQVESLKARNTRVESDKAWETSLTRVAVLVGITYLITALVFRLISVPNPLLNALIPTIGYLLSTQTLPVIKKWWLERQHK